tara:strand:- start:1601 stop:1945 length:345 start_codon:yes stop_codon:yes gene_type:complete
MANKIQIVNQNGTPVEVTDNNRLKVEMGDDATTNSATMLRTTGSTTITAEVKSISCYNSHASGTATIAIDGGSAIDLLAGETVNFDAGGGSNKFPASHFVINGTGANVLVIYVQ